MKICKECNKALSLDCFYKNNTYKDGYCGKCKACVKERIKNYYKENPLLLKERRKKQYLKDSKLNIAKSIEWGRNNKELRQLAKDKWRAGNKELTNHLTRQYHYRRKNAVGSHTLEEWNKLCDMSGNKCVKCGLTTKLTEDHIIPLSKGGTNYISNIQPLCVSCNSKKGNKLK